MIYDPITKNPWSSCTIQHQY